MTNERLIFLFNRYRASDCLPEELQELYILSLLPENQAALVQLAESTWNELPVEGDMPADLGEDILQRILKPSFHKSGPEPAKFRSMTLRRIAVAASILLVIGLGIYFLLFNNGGEKQDEIVKTEPAKDVKAPETNRATIQLSNGNIVYLDSANNGELAVQGNIKLVKQSNGQIAYQTASGEIVKELQYNTLSNPRGSKVIDMTFADGSRVWLNAGSSVTYPIAFVGNERKVTITGEAYFEITHDQSKPFKVSKEETEVTVLGTHFNVNAYDDESAIKVTLLEGSVKVTNDQSSLTIKPNQQAIVASANVTLNTTADVEAVMAWKNGRFQFTGAGIEEVMRQIARWYDVEVIYEVKPQDVHFRGGISRDVEASKVFKMLESTEAVHFRIEGKKVFVIR